MKKILSLLEDHLGDPSFRFIFPSQVAADFWRQKILTGSFSRAVRWERFLSWDSFKEELFALSRDELPANSRIRRLFCSHLLARFSREEEGSGGFQILVNPQYRKTAGIFQGYLASILPHLKSFWDFTADSSVVLEPALRGDLQYLYQSYLEFLSERRFFEPSWEKPGLGEDDYNYLLFFPGLIDDYREFQADLRAGGRFREITLEDAGAGSGEVSPDRPGPPLYLFSTSLEEVESFCLTLGALLDRNVEASGIAVTLTDPSLLPLLRLTAARYDIPLSIRTGAPLGESAEGRLFFRIRTCAAESYSLSSLKDLLLNQAYPWKEPELIRRLIFFGAENHCLRNLNRGENLKARDLWEEMFRLHERRKSGSVSDLREFYLAFRDLADRFSRAGTFRELSRTLEMFFQRFMDTRVWNPQGLQVLQRIRRSLGELRILEERLEGLNSPSCLDFFIQDLSGRTYVAQEETPGIGVYAYRVSAGIYPEHHFVLGLSQNATLIQTPPFPFLREDQRQLLNLEDRDFTHPFLRAYSCSGDNVYLSCSSAAPSGPELPAGIFVVEDRIRPAVPDTSSDPYLKEREFWAGETDRLPDVLTTRQSRGMENAGRLVFSSSEVNLAEAPLPEGSLLNSLLSRFRNDRGLLKVSPYRLKSWQTCAFAFLLQEGLGLEPLALTAEWTSPMEAGNLRHGILYRFFEDLKDEPFDQSRMEDYIKLMEKAVRETTGYWEGREPLAGTPFWPVLCRQVAREVLGFPAVEGRDFPGFIVQELEERHELDRPEAGVSLSGRIDRVSRRGEVLVLVDYKSSQKQSEKGMITPEGEPFSFQMPLYILLLEALGQSVEWAAYYDFKKSRYVYMLSAEDAKTNRERMDRALEVTEDRILEYRNSLVQGEFRTPDDCEACSFRIVCRKKYMVRGAARG